VEEEAYTYGNRDDDTKLRRWIEDELGINLEGPQFTYVAKLYFQADKKGVTVGVAPRHWKRLIWLWQGPGEAISGKALKAARKGWFEVVILGVGDIAEAEPARPQGSGRDPAAVGQQDDSMGGTHQARSTDAARVPTRRFRYGVLALGCLLCFLYATRSRRRQL
jgi:hypothetical protein